MSARSLVASAAVAAACALSTLGCAAAEERAAPALRPVSLPDLSNAAASVRDQIQSVHAAAMRRIDAPGTPPAEQASAYGELGTLLMAA